MKYRRINTLLLVGVLLVGASLLLYPSLSDHWNSKHQSQAITAYAEDVADLDEDQYSQLLEAATLYNAAHKDKKLSYYLTPEEKEEYNSMLNVSGSGIMGYIEIPSINCTLPVYHGTDDNVLQIAIGHLEWSSLPVGGEGTHCVLSGHRGLPSAKLFTDLDKLIEGDVFMLRILDEVLTYEVDQIIIVEPHDIAALHIADGEDYCTLFTCTPYGVNSHRLLVRGHRIESARESRIVRVISDAIQIDPLWVAPIIAAPIILVLLIAFVIPKKTTKTRGDDSENT